MAEFLNMDEEQLVTLYYGDIYWESGERFIRWDKSRRRPCPFLEEDKKCKIYPVRPEGCKAYPIDTNFGRYGVDCPAMKIIEAMDSEEEEDSLMDQIYLSFFNPEEKGIPCASFAYICLGSYSRVKIHGIEEIALSAQCTRYEEVKWWGDRLKEYIDKAVEEAKQKFTESENKSAQWLKGNRNDKPRSA
jgi:hypothetical protein